MGDRTKDTKGFDKETFWERAYIDLYPLVQEVLLVYSPKVGLQLRGYDNAFGTLSKVKVTDYQTINEIYNYCTHFGLSPPPFRTNPKSGSS